MLHAFFTGAAVWFAGMAVVLLLGRFGSALDPGALVSFFHVVAPCVLFIVILCLTDEPGPPFASVGGFFTAMLIAGAIVMTVDDARSSCARNGDENPVQE